jgi:(1->4)-alpha-D-glucan 1-alpha-D-glucosylmutase
MKRIPRATYRLQFNREFTFRQAREVLGYLEELGISDVYASPLFEAGPESTHGYDICCHGRINSNLGSEEDFSKFAADVRKRGLGLLVDIVPNHMSASLQNRWWADVLEKGGESRYSGFFDIESERPGSENKVLLPVLEDHYGKVLESGKLRLAYQDGKFSIAYHDRNFPLDLRTLPPGAEQDPSGIIGGLNGSAGQPYSFDRLDDLIRRQHYRLAYWKVAAQEINYRRFFDVAEMVAVKMERPEVFCETHRLIFEWLESGSITGLRVDHPDGLWDPREYFDRLQKVHNTFVVAEKILSGDEALPDDWPVDGTTGYDFLNRANGLFINESNSKVLSDIYREFTGITADFAEVAYVSRKLVLARAFVSELNALTRRLKEIAVQTRSGRDFTFSQLRNALEEIIAGFSVYRTYISEVSANCSARDRELIRKAVKAAQERTRLGGALLGFVERVLSLELRSELEESQGEAARAFVMKFQQLTGPAMAKGLEDTAFYRFNRLVSLNEVGGDPGKFGISIDEFHRANERMAKAWPHTMLASSTHDTKRGEDVRARINVLSEMPEDWRDAVARWSHSNSDKKTIVNGAPAPDSNDEYLLYQTLIGAWPCDDKSREIPDSFQARIAAFTLKAAREAKVHTSWTEPDLAYEDALAKFVGSVVSESGNEIFLKDLRRFARRVAFFGLLNSLAQTLLKIASPGVPDFYQGSELWDLNLVDPDNRGLVDYTIRCESLSDLKKKFTRANNRETISSLLEDQKTGTAKLYLIWRALNFRKEQPELFDAGEYSPLQVTGQKRGHVCSFARISQEQAVVAVAPRLVVGLTGGTELQPLGREVWGETALSLPGRWNRGAWRNVLTDETLKPNVVDGKPMLEISEVLKAFPVALLEYASES